MKASDVMTGIGFFGQYTAKSVIEGDSLRNDSSELVSGPFKAS